MDSRKTWRAWLTVEQFDGSVDLDECLVRSRRKPTEAQVRRAARKKLAAGAAITKVALEFGALA